MIPSIRLHPIDVAKRLCCPNVLKMAPRFKVLQCNNWDESDDKWRVKAGFSAQMLFCNKRLLSQKSHCLNSKQDSSSASAPDVAKGCSRNGWLLALQPRGLPIVQRPLWVRSRHSDTPRNSGPWRPALLPLSTPVKIYFPQSRQRPGCISSVALIRLPAHRAMMAKCRCGKANRGRRPAPGGGGGPNLRGSNDAEAWPRRSRPRAAPGRAALVRLRQSRPQAALGRAALRRSAGPKVHWTFGWSGLTPVP